MSWQPETITPKATLKQKVLATLLCTVALVVLSGGVFTWWLYTPPPMPGTTDEAARLLQSLRFNVLPPARKLDYGHHIRDLLVKASDAERQAFIDAIGDLDALRDAVGDMQREALVQRARQYALADEMGRRRLMGEMFFEFMQMRGMMKNLRPPGDPNAPPKTDEEKKREREERRAEFVGEIETAAATGNPQDMQLIGELFGGIQKQVGGMLGRRPGGARPPSNPGGSGSSAGAGASEGAGGADTGGTPTDPAGSTPTSPPDAPAR